MNIAFFRSVFYFLTLPLFSFAQKLIVYDEFEGGKLNEELWQIQPDFGPNINAFTDLSAFLPDNVLLDSGKLKLLLKRDPGCYDTWQFCNYDSCNTSCVTSYNDSCSSVPVKCGKVEQAGNNHCLCVVPKYFNYTGGMIYSKKKYLYGSFEIKCKIPKDALAAFWLYGDCCEEIDVFEFLNEDPRLFTFTIHECEPGKCEMGTGGKGHHMKGLRIKSGQDFSQDFNTWTLVWSPEYISLSVNGKEVRKCFRKGMRSCNPMGFFRGLLYPDNPLNVFVTLSARKNSPPFLVMEIEYIKIWEWEGVVK